jgi:hypothetical protein
MVGHHYLFHHTDITANPVLGIGTQIGCLCCVKGALIPSTFISQLYLQVALQTLAVNMTTTTPFTLKWGILGITISPNP